MLSTPTVTVPPDPTLRYACDPSATNGPAAPVTGFAPTARRALQRSFSSTSTHADAAQRSPVQGGVLDASHPWLSSSDRKQCILQLAMALTSDNVAVTTRAWRSLAASLYPVERAGGLFTRQDKPGGALLLQTHEKRPRAALADAIEGLTKSSAWLALCASGSRFSQMAVLPVKENSQVRPPLVIAIEVSESTKQKGWTMPLNEFLATASDSDLNGLWAWDLRPRALDPGAVHTLWGTMRALRTAGNDTQAQPHATALLARSTPVSMGHRGCRLAPANPDQNTPAPTPIPGRMRRSKPRTSTPTSSSDRKREFSAPPPPGGEDRTAAKAFRAERKRGNVNAWLDGVIVLDEDEMMALDEEAEEARGSIDVGEDGGQSVGGDGRERECILVFVGSKEFEEIMEQRLGNGRSRTAGTAKA